MKKLQFFLMIGALSMLMASCVKEDAEGISDASYNSFKINPPALTSDTKAYLDFAQDLSRILFEEGDPFYVNGVKFTLAPSPNDGSWVANRADGISEKVMSDGGYFYCCHADGVVNGYSSTDHTYNASISNNNTTTTGIVLAGKTESNVVTLTPCFAVLVFQPKGQLSADDYSSIRVGFATNNVPNIFTVSAESEAITAQSSYFPAVSQTPVDASFLTMHKIYDNYFYIAVPIEGNSKSMKLYMEYNLANGTTVKHVTKGNVTLEKGKVYMLPDETRNGYAFDENGAGVGVFSVSATQQVNFSAGNLQCTPQWAIRAWRFAEHQYDVSSSNASIGSNCTNWIDLFGFGTSGKKVGTSQFQPFATSGTFISSNLAGTNADWGYANNNSNDNWGYSPVGERAGKDAIQYGHGITNRSWRTLTQSEWNYLLNERNRHEYNKGGATVNGVSGLVILPDGEWNQPAGTGQESFNPSAGYSSNTYTIEQWDKMEKAGAIFLPVGGYRDGSGEGSVKQPVNGYYWTSTFYQDSKAYRLVIANNNRGNLGNQSTSFGMFVRLVSDVE